ncbi:uncharacterized protein LOC120343475 [Styela clava]
MGSVCSHSRSHLALQQNMLTAAPMPSAGRTQKCSATLENEPSELPLSNQLDGSLCELNSQDHSFHALQTPSKSNRKASSKGNEKKSPMRKKFLWMFKKKRKRDEYDDEEEMVEEERQEDENFFDSKDHTENENSVNALSKKQSSPKVEKPVIIENNNKPRIRDDIMDEKKVALDSGYKNNLASDAVLLEFVNNDAVKDYTSTCAGDSELDTVDFISPIKNKNKSHLLAKEGLSNVIKQKEPSFHYQSPVEESENGGFYGLSASESQQSSVISTRVAQQLDAALDSEEFFLPEPSQKSHCNVQDWRTHSLNVEVVYQGRRLSSAEKDWLGEQVAGLVNILLNKGKIPENLSLINEEIQEAKMVEYQNASLEVDNQNGGFREQYIAPHKNDHERWEQDHEDSDDISEHDLSYDPYGLKQQKYERREKKRARKKYGSVIQELTRKISQETMKNSDSTSSANTFHTATEFTNENNRLPNPAAASKGKSLFVRVCVNEVGGDPNSTSPKIEFHSKSEPFIYAGHMDEKVANDDKSYLQNQMFQQTTISASSPHVFRIEEEKTKQKQSHLDSYRNSKNIANTKDHSPKYSAQQFNQIQTKISDSSSSSSASSVIELSKLRHLKQDFTKVPRSHSRRSARTPTPVGAKSIYHKIERFGAVHESVKNRKHTPSPKHDSSPRRRHRRSRNNTPIQDSSKHENCEDPTSPITIVNERRTPLVFQRVSTTSPVALRPEPLSFTNMAERNIKSEKVLRKVLVPTPVYANKYEVAVREEMNHPPVPKPRTRITCRPVPAPRIRKQQRRQSTPNELLEGNISPRPIEGEQIDIPKVHHGSSRHRDRKLLSPTFHDAQHVKPTKLPSEMGNRKEKENKRSLHQRKVIRKDDRNEVPQNMVPLTRTPSNKKYTTRQKSCKSPNQVCDQVQDHRKVWGNVKPDRQEDEHCVEKSSTNRHRQKPHSGNVSITRKPAVTDDNQVYSSSSRVLNKTTPEKKKTSTRKTILHPPKQAITKGLCPPQFIQTESGFRSTTKKHSRVTFEDELCYEDRDPQSDHPSHNDPVTETYDPLSKINTQTDQVNMSMQDRNIPMLLSNEKSESPAFNQVQQQGYPYSNYQQPVFCVNSAIPQRQLFQFAETNVSNPWSSPHFQPYLSPGVMTSQIASQQQIFPSPTPSRINISGCYFPTPPNIMNDQVFTPAQPYQYVQNTTQQSSMAGVYSTLPVTHTLSGTASNIRNTGFMNPISPTTVLETFNAAGTLSAPTTPRNSNQMEFPSNLNSGKKTKSEDRLFQDMNSRLSSNQHASSDCSLDKSHKTRKWRQIVRERDEVNAWWMPKDWAKERGIGNYGKNQRDSDKDCEAKKEKELEIAKDANVEQIRMSKFVPL